MFWVSCSSFYFADNLTLLVLHLKFLLFKQIPSWLQILVLSLKCCGKASTVDSENKTFPLNISRDLHCLWSDEKFWDQRSHWLEFLLTSNWLTDNLRIHGWHKLTKNNSVPEFFNITSSWRNLVSLYHPMSTVPCVWMPWETQSPSPVVTPTAWSASRSTGTSLTTWVCTVAHSAVQPSHHGRCWGAICPTWTTSHGASFQSSCLSHTCTGNPSAISASVGATRPSSHASCVWPTTAKRMSSRITSHPPSSDTNWWMRQATWTGKSAPSMRKAWSCSVVRTRCASACCVLSENTAATTLHRQKKNAPKSK